MFDFKFDWDPSLELGISELDRHHQELFKIGRDIEQLLIIKCINTQDGDLLNILYKLREYITYHFYEEEKLMQNVGYPNLLSHSSEHQKLLSYINHIDYIKLCNHPIQELTLIKEYIVSWIFHHMINEDKNFAQYYHTYQNE